MQLEGGSAQSARDSVKGHLWKERGVEAPGTEQGSGSPRGQKDKGRRRQAGAGCWWQRLSRRVPQKPHFSGRPGAHAGHLHASCRVGLAGGLQMCLGLAWWRVWQGRSSSAGIGRVGQLAHGGRWLAGARSSARCRWSRGEAGSLRGIWLSCWRCTGGEREGGTRVRWVPRRG